MFLTARATQSQVYHVVLLVDGAVATREMVAARDHLAAFERADQLVGSVVLGRDDPVLAYVLDEHQVFLGAVDGHSRVSALAV